MHEDSYLEEPNDDDCCHSGCTPCVFDIYQMKLKSQSMKDQSVRSDLLSQTKFKPFTVMKVVDSGSNCRTFRLQPQASSLEGRLPYRPGQHLVLRALTPSLQNLQREYSVISDSDSEVDCCFEVVIKLYGDGQMSQYLKQLKEGDETFWRGPYGDFEYVPNSHRHLLMLAMGTGVAPLYSVAKSIVENDTDETILTALLAFQNTSSIVLRRQLNHLLSFWNFRCRYFFSNSSKEPLNYLETGVDRKIQFDDLKEVLSNKVKDTLVLVCGSEEFCEQIKCQILEIEVPEKNIFTF